MIDRKQCNIRPLKQLDLDWLSGKGASPQAIMNPSFIGVANGPRASGGYFEYRHKGPDWFVFVQRCDVIFWQTATGELAWELGRCFALSEELVANPSTTAFGPLAIFAEPLGWLVAGRQGIVMVQWVWCFEWLRDVPEIALAPELEPLYRSYMTPKLPRVSRLVQKPSTSEVAA